MGSRPVNGYDFRTEWMVQQLCVKKVDVMLVNGVGALISFSLVVMGNDGLAVPLAVLERQSNEVGGYEVVFTVDNVAVLDAKTNVKQESHYEYRELFDGGRRRLEWLGSHDAQRPRVKVDTISVLLDGRRSVLDRSENTGVVGADIESFPPGYNSTSYMFGEGIFNWLKANRDRLKVTSDTVDGAELLKCAWVDPDCSYHVWLNPKKHFQPVQIELFSEYRPEHYSDGRSRGTIRSKVVKYWESENIALPAEVSRQYEVEFANGRRQIMSDLRMVVVSVTPHKSYTEQDFILTFPDGCRMTDLERKVSYIQGDPKSERRVGEPVDNLPMGPDGVRLGRLKRGWWWWLTLIGVVAAGAAGVRYWRRR